MITLNWLKTPSVFTGGHHYFWNAYRGETGKGLPAFRVVWDRSARQWALLDPQHPDATGRSAVVAWFATDAKAKAFAEASTPA